MESCEGSCGGGSCGDSCSRPAALELDERVLRAAQKLAGLLAETAEFQDLVRVSRAVRLDPQVSEQMSRVEDASEEADPAVLEAAEQQLEALDIVRAYRQAEQSARAVFCAVDETISGTSGVAFAENAKPSACG